MWLAAHYQDGFYSKAVHKLLQTAIILWKHDQHEGSSPLSKQSRQLAAATANLWPVDGTLIKNSKPIAESFPAAEVKVKD